MRTRTFLRTSEFLWQEGHTAHATREEAEARTRMMLDVYTRLAETYLAMPVIPGAKSASERFPGAVDTYCIEAMMQDRKALQAGTSHFLGQNFAKSSNIRFQSADKIEEYAWTTSWGVSTRLIGGLIMAHGDDDGIILPPRVAPSHLVLLPIVRKEQERADVMTYVERLARELKAQRFDDQPVRVQIDDREGGGARGWEWIKKGIPIRVEIGPRDMASDSVFFARRDRGHREKTSMKRTVFVAEISRILLEIQENLFNRAASFMAENIHRVETREAFYDFFTPKNSEKPEIHGGFASSHWCEDASCEAAVKEELSVTIRCIPLSAEPETGRCVYCGKPSHRRVIFAKAY
jgi:prolyl-tRNA synthetase